MVLRLIVGDDPILVGEAISASVEELVGDGDRSLMLELLTETDYRNDDAPDVWHRGWLGALRPPTGVDAFERDGAAFRCGAAGV